MNESKIAERMNAINTKNLTAEDIEFLKKCTEKGIAGAAHNLAVLYFWGKGVEKDYTEARHYAEIANSLNDHYSLRMLGDIYLYGLGTEEDYEKAFEYYKKDIEKPHKGFSSEDRLAECYFFGKGVERDAEKAAAYFTQAAASINEMLQEVGDGFMQVWY